MAIAIISAAMTIVIKFALEIALEMAIEKAKAKAFAITTARKKNHSQREWQW